MKTIDKEQLEEINNIMNYAIEAIGEGDHQLGEEYLQDAVYLINKIEDEQLRKEVAASYTINPLDFAI